MKRIWLLALSAPLALQAQVALSTLAGTTETPVTSSFNFGSIPPFTTKDVTFRARGTGSAPVTITKLALSGIGFAIVNTSTLPVTVAQGNAFDFFVRFTGGPVGSFSANLQVNTVIVALSGTVAQAVTLTVAAPCAGPDSQGNISFGRIAQTLRVTCTFTLANPFTQALAVSPIALAGAAFQSALPSSASIPAGQSLSFAVIFTAAAASTFTGTLTAGIETYFLSGTGFLTPLPAPLLSFDTTTLHSGEQHTLTAALPSPAPAAVNGSITMGFTPGSSAVTDDTAVQFVATSKRAVSFSVAQGATSMLLNNQPGAIFSTGTTAGFITFTVNAGAIGISGSATTTTSIAAAPVAVTAASATSRTADLDITVTGFDNTYSLGPASFTFYDRSGNTLGAPVQADFSTPFHVFYQGQTAGSAFTMLVSFPVTGNQAAVGAVDVKLSNTAGTATLQRLNFP